MAIPMQAPLQSVGNTPDWSILRGTTLDGGYELKEILAAEADKARFRVRVLGDYSLRATAFFFALSGTAASEQVGCWELVRLLDRSASVVRPLGIGILHANMLQLAYLVVPETEESLAEALKSRALSGDEAKELLRSIARGLAELHAVGLVHGCVSPEEILATSDSILLSGECVRATNSRALIPIQAKYLAPESSGENVTAAADVWCLGAVLVEALTQKEFDRSNAGVVESLEHPFSLVAASCLEPDPDLRCKPGDVDALLRSPKPIRAATNPIPEKQISRPLPKVSEPTAPVERPEIEEIGASETPTTAVHPTTVPIQAERNGNLNKAAEHEPFQRVTDAASVEPRRIGKLPNELPNELPGPTVKRPQEEARPARGVSRALIYGVTGALIIVLVILYLRAGEHPSSTPGLAAATVATRPPVATPGTAWPTKTLGPNTPATRTAAIPIGTPKAPSATAGKGSGATAAAGNNPADWRVVLFTFNRKQDADTRAAALVAQHPDLDARVFSPTGDTGPYLVVVGGPVTRAEAMRVRQQALRSGMPRDTYIQNFRR